MSWFDTAGFASLAKSALKEAQKTIDKALDINEDEVDKHPEVEGKSFAIFFDLIHCIFISDRIYFVFCT